MGMMVREFDVDALGKIGDHGKEHLYHVCRSFGG